jgi:branched-chain amino acid transport system substrate-binding protein
MYSKKLGLLLAIITLISVVTLTACASSTPAPTTSAQPATAVPTTAAPPTAAQAKTLKVGVIIDLSGFLSVFFIQDEKDLELTAQMINDKGGITVQGQKYNIQLAVEDGKSSPDGALSAANKLVYDEQIKFALGPMAFEGAATTPIFEANKVLHVFNYSDCNPTSINPNTIYGFVGDNAPVGQAIAMFKITQKEFPKAKTVAIVLPDDGSPPFLMPKYKPILESMGYTVLNGGNPVTFPNNMEDFTPIADKLNALNPDAIIQTSSTPASVGSIVKGLRSLGNTVPYICNSFGSIPAVLDIIGPAGSTNFITLNYTADDPNNPPLLKELIAKMPPNSFITFSYANCLYVLTQVMQKANSSDPEAVKTTWESMDTVDTLFGTGILGGDQTYGLKHHAVGVPVPYQKVMNGQVQTLPYSDWMDVGAIP